MPAPDPKDKKTYPTANDAAAAIVARARTYKVGKSIEFTAAADAIVQDILAMPWSWTRVADRLPAMRDLVMVTIRKGATQCPMRPEDHYVAMAAWTGSSWAIFGAGGMLREDEVITHWCDPNLPYEVTQAARAAGVG